jgi:hypothetical protein
MEEFFDCSMGVNTYSVETFGFDKISSFKKDRGGPEKPKD